ncbi:MAG TPA: hypothetical protein PKG77_17595 [Phycisphaerae bacterium]|nr:hypothetical protein [Phycisphaerae bacterium]HQL71904.1 hypothetical protein [Phycisphaerae bacterium]
MMKSVYLVLLLAASLIVPLTAAGDEVTDIAIQVSPNVIALRSNGTWLTIHADISFAVVDKDSVQLEIEGVTLAPQSLFADDCGDLVAKFPLNAVKDIVKDKTSATMTLSGLTIAGDAFVGSATVAVR